MLRDVTESRSVVVQSIVALIDGRDPNPQDLALEPRERTGTVHELSIELEVQPHYLRMHAVDLDDVIRIGHSAGRRDVGFVNIAYVRHGASVPHGRPRSTPSLARLTGTSRFRPEASS